MKDTARFAAYLCVGLSALGGCAKNRDKDSPAPAQPKVLSLAAFQAPTFADLPWEEKCSGTMQFFKDFQREYLPDAELSFSDLSCTGEVNWYNTYYDQVEPIFTRDGQTLQLEIHLTTFFNSSKLNLDPDNVDLQRRRSDSDLSRYAYESDDAKIGTNLFNLGSTFDAWLNQEPEGPVTIYGYSYPEFLALIQQKFGPESSGMKLTSPQVTFKLTPDPNDSGAGKVEFTSADLTNYAPGKLLGCSDLSCLQSSGITFKVAGPSLVLEGPSTQEGSDNGIPVSVRPLFRIHLDFLKKN